MKAEAECRVLCRYLCGQDPSEYVVRCYTRALDSAAPPPGSRVVLIDRSLLGLARLGSLPARIADCYAGIFRPSGGLRRRLILLLAILENAPPTADPLNAARVASRLGLAAGMSLTLLASGIALAAGLVLLGPLHLLGSLRAQE